MKRKQHARAQRPKQPQLLFFWRLVTRRWFDDKLTADEQRYMIPLLVGACLAEEQGAPFSKKTAATVMGAEDLKTARKYTKLAEEKGLLVAGPSADDRRKELLHPTPLLWELLMHELNFIGHELVATDVGANGQPGSGPLGFEEQIRNPAYDKRLPGHAVGGSTGSFRSSSQPHPAPVRPKVPVK